MLTKLVSNISFSLLLLCSIAAQGQFAYFNKTYDSGLSTNQTDAIWDNACHEVNTGFKCFAWTSDNITEETGVFFLSFTPEGDTIYTKKHLFNDIRQVTQNAIMCEDSSFTLAGTARILPEDVNQVALFKLDKDGDILWRKYHGTDSTFENVNHHIKTSDGGYALCGSTSNLTATVSDCYILKLDSMGEFEWQHAIGGSNYEAFRSLIETSDRGFLLLGWTRSFGAGLRDFYLVKTDSMGNFEWQETYGTEEEEIGARIIKLTDGNYLLTGSSGGVGGSFGKAYKINSNNNSIIWEKQYTYDQNSGNNIHTTYELADGNLVSAGMTNNTSNAGWLLKTNSDGELIWQREYDYNGNTDLFYGLLPTSDNGFLLQGQMQHGVQPGQDAWLVKVDEWGCEFENCTVGIEEEANQKVHVNTYPNPFNNSFNVSYQLESEAKELKLEVFDLLGRNVHTEMQYNNSGGRRTIDMGDCLGVYILRMTADDKVVYQTKVLCSQN